MKRPKVITKYERHKRLYRLIEGAVIDAFNQHPEYLAEGIQKVTVVTSVTKRVTGLVLANPHLVQGETSPEDGLK